VWRRSWNRQAGIQRWFLGPEAVGDEPSQKMRQQVGWTALAQVFGLAGIFEAVDVPLFLQLGPVENLGTTSHWLPGVIHQQRSEHPGRLIWCREPDVDDMFPRRQHHRSKA
jgi:hypothetical protein